MTELINNDLYIYNSNIEDFNNIWLEYFDLNKDYSSIKIELVRELNHQRDVSKKIISELKSKDLLVKKDLKVNINNEEKTILKDFYVIDIDKLIKLDDKIKRFH